MSDISIAESKIQILYLVDRAPGVSYHLLMEKCMESLYTDFFTFSRSYEELISGNLMDKSSSGAFTGDAVGSTENLTLTDGGRAVLNDLLSSLNAPLRARLDEAASAIVSEMALLPEIPFCIFVSAGIAVIAAKDSLKRILSFRAITG